MAKIILKKNLKGRIRENDLEEIRGEKKGKRERDNLGGQFWNL